MSTIFDKPENMELAREWVASGNPCIFRRGLNFRGAKARRISQEVAEEKIKYHQFGVGFYTMCWNMHEGQDVLEFNELNENDLY